MKTNVTINIAGVIFHLEESAKNAYLDFMAKIKNYYISTAKTQWKVKEIEGRISEILLEQLDEGKQINTSEDVNTMIQNITAFYGLINSQLETPTQPKQVRPLHPKKSTSHDIMKLAMAWFF